MPLSSVFLLSLGVGVFSTSFNKLRKNLISNMWTSMCIYTHICTQVSPNTPGTLKFTPLLPPQSEGT